MSGKDRFDPARLRVGVVPWEALTKEQHDELVAKRDRPITQDPISRHRQSDNSNDLKDAL